MSVAPPTVEHMFDAVIGPRMRVTEETVVVWMDSGRPTRLVYQRTRWRVAGEPTPIVEVPDELDHALITHAQPRQTGWVCLVRQDDSGETRLLKLRRREHGWEVEEEGSL